MKNKTSYSFNRLFRLLGRKQKQYGNIALETVLSSNPRSATWKLCDFCQITFPVWTSLILRFLICNMEIITIAAEREWRDLGSMTCGAVGARICGTAGPSMPRVSTHLSWPLISSDHMVIRKAPTGSVPWTFQLNIHLLITGPGTCDVRHNYPCC